jgi:hypothetical protein
MVDEDAPHDQEETPLPRVVREFQLNGVGLEKALMSSRYCLSIAACRFDTHTEKTASVSSDTDLHPA